jgi:hypothetical protein
MLTYINFSVDFLGLDNVDFEMGRVLSHLKHSQFVLYQI